MKILIVVAHDHFHGQSGGGTAVRALKARIDDAMGSENVNLLCFDSWGSWMPRPIKQAVSIVSSLFSDMPSRSVFLLPSKSNQYLREVIAKDPPDCVVINGGDVWPIISSVPSNVPIVLISHNVEYLLMQAQIQQLSGVAVLLRHLLQKDVEKLCEFEIAAARRAKNVLSISEEDAAYFRGLADDINVATFLPTFDYEPFNRIAQSYQQPLKVGFMAKMSWWPNREGALWFIKNVLCHLSPRKVHAHFFGAGSEEFARSATNLTAHGFVDSLDEVWKKCDLMICPIFSGSGVNIKFVEALFNGMPVLATTKAARGLPPISDPNIIYLDSAQEWIDFLTSTRAQDLANGRVSPLISNLFRPAKQTEDLGLFFRSIITGQTKN